MSAVWTGWRASPLCGLDTETDGTDPESAHIITATVGIVQGQEVWQLLIAACLILAWTPATGALAAVGCALIFWTVLCHLATTPNSDEMDA